MVKSTPHLPARLVLAACALIVAAGCGSDDEQSTRKSASVRAEATPSPDLASRVVEGDELAGYRLVAADIALHRDGFVAGTGKRFEPRQGRGVAESIVVQMRDAEGAGAEAERRFRSAFAPWPGERKCATGIERFGVPRVPGAEAVEIRHKVDGEVLYTTAIVFAKGAFVYQVSAGGPRIDDRRTELIDAAGELYARVRDGR